MHVLKIATALVAISLLQGSTHASNTTPSLAFDHVWIRVSPNAPEAEALTDAGFILASGIRHAGMGTANTGVMFHNAYLELLWVEDTHALQRAAPDFAHTLLGGSDASPFGLGLRRANDRDELPFETTSISAEWMTPGTSIEVALRFDHSSAYPPIFVVPRDMGFPEWQDEVTEIQMNSLGIRDLTRVRLHGPGLSDPPPPIDELTVPGFVQFVSAEHHLLELEFDERTQDGVLDLRPTLPLVIRY